MNWNSYGKYRYTVQCGLGFECGEIKDLNVVRLRA